MTDPVTDPARHPALSGVNEARAALTRLTDQAWAWRTDDERERIRADHDAVLAALAREPAGETRVEEASALRGLAEAVDARTERLMTAMDWWTDRDREVYRLASTDATDDARARADHLSPVAPDAEDETGGVG